ncbi:MAG: hypothetical protein V8R55_01115 [Dysosmobacter sp.]
MAFGYRRSLLTQNPEIVALSAVFALTPGDPGGHPAADAGADAKA